jgi:hypothetical protein
MAKAMNYEEKNGLQPVNRFLGCLHEQMEFLKQLHLTFIYEMEIKSKKFSKKNAVKDMKSRRPADQKRNTFFQSA